MQQFHGGEPKYAYDAGHAPVGTVEAGELFQVECVEGFGSEFASAADFSPERYARAQEAKWGVTGPIAVDGALSGCAVAVTLHAVEVMTPGTVIYGSYADDDVHAWWDDETACNVYHVREGRLRFDDRTELPVRPLVGCLAVAPEEGEVHAMLQGTYGGNVDCSELRAGATLVLPVFHDGALLYFGDCKALMGNGEIVQPPEVGALVTASAEARPRPLSMTWPRIESFDALATLVSGRPLEWAAREAFRELLGWVVEDYELSRPEAALLLGMVANTGICQVSNTKSTASCMTSRTVLEPYRRT